MSARIPMRALIVLGLVALAYPWSLLTLTRGVTLQTPLAYLALVPVIALVLARFSLTRQPAPMPIHDRQLDYIIGLALILMAGAILLLLPDSLRSRFWLYRIDLLSLPFFVAGVVTLLYGVRRLWALRIPILFLFLAWPVPYLPLVGDGLRTFTDLSIAAATAIASVNPAATPGAGEGTSHRPVRRSTVRGPHRRGLRRRQQHGRLPDHRPGADLRGPRPALAKGRLVGPRRLVLVWLFNVLRIEAILTVGALFGRQAAYDVLHPVAGLLLFNLAIFIMLRPRPVFGLRWRPALAGDGADRAHGATRRRQRASSGPRRPRHGHRLRGRQRGLWTILFPPRGPGRARDSGRSS